MLLINALDWFAGNDSGLVASYATGRPWRLPVPPGATELSVRAPDGDAHAARRCTTAAPATSAMHVGFYELESAGAPDALVAVNLANAEESSIAPRAHAQPSTDERWRAPELGRIGVRRELWGYFVLFALLLAFVEWWTYNRRVTV